MGSLSPEACAELGQKIEKAEEAWEEAVRIAYEKKTDAMEEIDRWLDQQDSLAPSQIEELEAKIDDAREEIEEMDKQIAELEAEKKQLDEFRSQAASELEDVQAELNKLDETYQQYDVDFQELIDLQKNAEEWKTEREQSDDPERRRELAEKILEARDRIREIADGLPDTADDIIDTDWDDLLEERERLKAEIDGLDTDRIELSGAIEELDKDRGNREMDISEWEARIREGRQNLEELRTRLELEEESTPGEDETVQEALKTLNELYEYREDHCL